MSSHGEVWIDVLKRCSRSWVLLSMVLWIGALRWKKAEGCDALEIVSGLLNFFALMCEHVFVLRPGGSFKTGIKLLRQAAQSSSSSGHLVALAKTMTTKATAYSAITGGVAIAAGAAVIAQALVSRISTTKRISPRTLLSMATVGLVVAGFASVLVGPQNQISKESALVLRDQIAPVLRSVMIVRAIALARYQLESIVMSMQAAPLVASVATWAYSLSSSSRHRTDGKDTSTPPPEDHLAIVIDSSIILQFLALALLFLHLLKQRRKTISLLALSLVFFTTSPYTIDVLILNTDLEPKPLHALVTILSCFLTTLYLLVGGTQYCLCLLLVFHLLFTAHHVDFASS